MKLREIIEYLQVKEIIGETDIEIKRALHGQLARTKAEICFLL